MQRFLTQVLLVTLIMGWFFHVNRPAQRAYMPLSSPHYMGFAFGYADNWHDGWSVKYELVASRKEVSAWVDLRIRKTYTMVGWNTTAAVFHWHVLNDSGVIDYWFDEDGVEHWRQGGFTLWSTAPTN